MIRFSPRMIVALAAATGFSTLSLVAQAEEKPPFINDAAPVTAPAVSAIAPADVAGVLNYCIQTDLVSHGDGDAVQTSLNTKINAVPSDQAGNVDYANGSTGEFVVGNTISTITKLSIPDRGKICSAVLTRAKSLI